MRITASTVAGHRFGIVRKRGYDPIEVDAVLDRVADTLKEYEALADRREEPVRVAHEPLEALMRTFEAADRTKEQMIAEGVAEAERLKSQAENDCIDMIQTAWTEARRIREGAEREAADGHQRVASRLERLETELEDREIVTEMSVARAQVRAAELEDGAERNAALRLEAADAEVQERRRAAVAQAEEIVASAAGERERLVGNLDDLRAELNDTKQRLRTVALTALNLVEAPRDEEQATPFTVDLTNEDVAEPDGSGMLPAERPSRDESTTSEPHGAGLQGHIAQSAG